jgi:hypothetical protein
MTYFATTSSSQLSSEDLNLVFQLGLLLEKLIGFAGETVRYLK